MTPLLLILILSYPLGIFLCWKWCNIAYNKGGIRYPDKPEKADIIITSIPILNIVVSVIVWILHNPYLDFNKRFDNYIIKFFKIKN